MAKWISKKSIPWNRKDYADVRKAGITDLLEDILTKTPMSLMDISRIAIRRHLGHDLPSKTKQLEIPEHLKPYLVMF